MKCRREEGLNVEIERKRMKSAVELVGPRIKVERMKKEKMKKFKNTKPYMSN